MKTEVNLLFVCHCQAQFRKFLNSVLQRGNLLRQQRGLIYKVRMKQRKIKIVKITHIDGSVQYGIMKRGRFWGWNKCERFLELSGHEIQGVKKPIVIWGYDTLKEAQDDLFKFDGSKALIEDVKESEADEIVKALKAPLTEGKEKRIIIGVSRCNDEPLKSPPPTPPPSEMEIECTKEKPHD